MFLSDSLNAEPFFDIHENAELELGAPGKRKRLPHFCL
jgi:hypothetical protein